MGLSDGFKQKYSSSSSKSEGLFLFSWLFLLDVLYLSRRINMMTKATKSRVTTTPMRIPSTGVNSSGTGLSAKRKILLSKKC